MLLLGGRAVKLCGMAIWHMSCPALTSLQALCMACAQRCMSKVAASSHMHDGLKGLSQLKQQHLKRVGELDFNFLEFIQLSAGLDALQRTPCIYFASEGKGQGRSWGSPIGTPLTHQHKLSSLHARHMVATHVCCHKDWQ